MYPVYSRRTGRSQRGSFIIKNYIIINVEKNILESFRNINE